MYTITTETKTVEVRTVIVELTESDIAKILIDPRSFQKQLRSVKSTWQQNGSTWSATGHAAKTTPKKSRSVESRKSTTHRVACDICGKMVGAQGMHKHLAKHAANAE